MRSGYPEQPKMRKNARSAGAERVKTKKIAVPTPWNERISQKRLFQPLGTSEILKNDCSNPLERANFSKTVVPTPWNKRISQKQLFQPLGTSEFFKRHGKK